jgi:AI-2 transport protein TqsA
MKISMGIIAVVLVVAAARLASSVFAPLALALFIIALVWPVQSSLQKRVSKLPALAITILMTLAVGLAFASLAAWGFGRVGRSVFTDTARYQSLYDSVVIWLDSHGVSIAGLWAEHFNVRWLLRTTQYVTGRVNTTLTFWLVEALENHETARILLVGSAATAAKLRKYVLVRTQMSALTGVFVGVFAWISGLQFAIEWGVIAFTLNYIPFIGPFIATLFPTLLAMTQFDSWESVVIVFVCLNVIQFVIGSYIEPRFSGNVLSISPLVVLFATLFWTFLWGLFGTFIGVPIVLAVLSFCGQHPSSRWIADLLGGPTPAKTG